MRKLKLLIVFYSVIFCGFISADEFRTVRTTGQLALSKYPAYAVQNLAAGQVTPNVSLGTVMVTGINVGQTTLSGFTNQLAGNVLHIIGNASTTSNATMIPDSGAFKLSAEFVASANNSLTLLVRSSGDYVEIGRSTN